VTPTGARSSTASRACGAAAWATAATEIAEAVGRQAAQLDYSPAFQFGHPLSFELANRIVGFMPEGLNRVFFTGSGSEAPTPR
jgi:adenosylmethionine-8-amino-7-oxononanoate aminotransferase